MEQPTCKTCRWWMLHMPEDDVGECRRYPPNIGQVRAEFPATSPGMWCGEHKPAETLCTTTLDQA